MKDYSLITNRLGLQLKSQLGADKNHNLTETYFVYADDLLSLLENSQCVYALSENSNNWGSYGSMDNVEAFLVGKSKIMDRRPNPVTREELTAINERLSKWGVK